MTGTNDPVVMTLLDIALIILLGWVAARLARRAGQPPVVGEILVGIALGPSLLGLLPGDLSRVLFPLDARPFLQLVAQLGLVLFMVGVGYDLEPEHLRGRSRSVVSVSAGSLVLPFGAGIALGSWLVSRHPGTAAAPVFVLMFACAMAMTAFPVLARIVADAGMTDRPVGRVALISASINDLVAWVVLAAVLALAGAHGGTPPWLLLLGLCAHLAVLVAARRHLLPTLLRWAGRAAGRDSAVLVVLVAAALASAGLSSVLGIHAVVGAFAFGVAIPRVLADDVVASVRPTIDRMSMVLLPIFFVVAGFGVDVTSLGGAGVVDLAVVVVVACCSKLLGAGLGALAGGMSRRQAADLGVLMNARGLTELIVLQIGRQTGVLDQSVFTIMTLMAILTTVAAGPLLGLVRGHWKEPAAAPPDERSAAAGPETRPTSARPRRGPRPTCRYQPQPRREGG